jgi:hypothetical protein
MRWFAVTIWLTFLLGCSAHRHQDLVGVSYDLPWSLEQSRTALRKVDFIPYDDDRWNRVRYSFTIPSEMTTGTDVTAYGVLVSTGPSSSCLTICSYSSYGNPNLRLTEILPPIEHAVKQAKNTH